MCARPALPVLQGVSAHSCLETSMLFLLSPPHSSSPGFLLKSEKIEQLRYHPNYELIPGTISDVFDGEHYRELRTQKVVVDGKELPYCYFSGEYDIALGFCADSYLLLDRCRKGPSATPILSKLYSLSPEIRTHLLDLLCCRVIPGPKGPKDAHSYLVSLTTNSHGWLSVSQHTIALHRRYSLFMRIIFLRWGYHRHREAAQCQGPQQFEYLPLNMCPKRSSRTHSATITFIMKCGPVNGGLLFK
jgi:hypothetical protein